MPCPRLPLLALVALLAAPPARAQYAVAARVRPAAPAVPAHRLDALAHLGEAEAAKAIPGQYVSALAGGVAGLAGGTLLGLLAAGGDARENPEAAVLVGAAVGWLGGTTYALHRFSTLKGARGKPLAGFGGAVLGLVGGPVAILTVPLGATWAYNRSRDGSAP